MGHGRILFFQRINRIWPLLLAVFVLYQTENVYSQIRSRARPLKTPRARTEPQPTPTPAPQAEESAAEVKEVPKPVLIKRFEGSAESAMSLTSGNTSVRNFGFATELRYRPEPWEFSLKSSYLNSSDQSVPIAESFSLNLRGGHRLTERSDIFTEFSYLANRFAGLDNRVMPEVGYGYDWLLADTMQLRTETALGYTFEDRTDETLSRYLNARLGFLLAWKLTERLEFSTETSVLPNLESGREWLLRSETELALEAADGFALKFSYRYDYNNAPIPDKSPEDTRTTSSLVIKF